MDVDVHQETGSEWPGRSRLVAVFSLQNGEVPFPRLPVGESSGKLPFWSNMAVKVACFFSLP